MAWCTVLHLYDCQSLKQQTDILMQQECQSYARPMRERTIATTPVVTTRNPMMVQVLEAP